MVCLQLQFEVCGEVSITDTKGLFNINYIVHFPVTALDYFANLHCRIKTSLLQIIIII